MYRRFAFEGSVHEDLECVPLAVRRKLDLAALKISLAGWQSLARAERLALCHLPVDSPEDLAVYREVLAAFALRADLQLAPLPEVDPERAWGPARVPDAVAARLPELGAVVSAAQWSSLDEEARYCVVKLADPKRDAKKLGVLLAELGLTSS